MRTKLVCLLVVAIGASGCARERPPQVLPPSTGGPQTVTIDLRNAGQTITIGQGGHLVVDLPVPPKGPQWVVASYPRNILSPLALRPVTSAVGFVAMHAGSGDLVAELRCPELQPDQPVPLLCTLKGRPSQKVTFRIVVLGRGG